MIVAAHQTMMGPPALPYDAEVEYLESTGTQYVDTGIAPNGLTDFLVDTQITSGAISLNMFGCRDVSSGRPAFGLITHSAGPSISIARLSDSAWNDLIPADSLRHEYSFIGGVAYFDGANAGNNSGSTQLSNTAFIFMFNNAGIATGTARQRVFGVKFWQNGTLVRSFVPVRVGQTGYLFDRASGQLFGNAGAGAFTIGPDKT